ncbi:MAG TPA: amino acid adenylation domain-containing protein [Pyrinomonadaceae bacterium]|jgi:amino acid adenylation domain-containing protein
MDGQVLDLDLTVGQLTLVDLLQERAGERPDRPAYTYLADDGGEESRLTYAALDARARAIAATLQGRVGRGERALLLYPQGLEFVAAFFGCLYAGVVAVPCYPPHPARPERTLPRLRAIADSARPRVVLTTPALLRAGEAVRAQAPELSALDWLATDEADADAEQWRRPELTGDAPAFLQYTSGSTAAPKGVTVSHANLLHNQSLLRAAFATSSETVVLGWLPLYHDMGLIGNVLHPLYVGAECVLMSPAAFMRRPLSWLEAISRRRATTSGGPNFAYDLCVRRSTPAERAALDLSSWTVAFNGAEPVRQATLERFAEAFAPGGFRPEAFLPCYGLAEATLFVSGNRNAEPPGALRVVEEAIARDRIAEADADDAAALSLVGCGRPAEGQRVAVVNPETCVPTPPDGVGEIWVAGPSVARGYWANPEETAATFEGYLAETGEGPFLRTGDLGFLRDGELFVTGRLKDLIIIRGLNHYPQDVEATVESSHPELQTGGCAAFSLEAGGEERLAVVAEVSPRASRKLRGLGAASPEVAALIEAVRGAVAGRHQLQTYTVALLGAGALPKTSSGKVQRRLCRARLLAGELDVLASSTLDESAVAEAAVVYDATDDAGLELPAPRERGRGVAAWLRAEVAAALGVRESAVDPGKPLGALGLDSLLAVELRYRIENEFAVSMPLTTFFEETSLEDLAARIGEQLESGGQSGEDVRGTSVTPAALHGRQDGHPLSYGQQALWFLHKLERESAAYHVVLAARLPGGADAEAVRAALQTLADRHASLRTTFEERDGVPVRRVHEPGAAVCFEAVSAGRWDEDELRGRVETEAHRPFDLGREYPLRARLFTRADGRHVLLLVTHHIAVDFWSLMLLTEELSSLFTSEGGPRQRDSFELSTQYTDFARWQAALLEGPAGDAHLAYWRRKLGGELTALQLPTDRARTPSAARRGAAHEFTLDGEVGDALRELARREGTTLYAVLLAAFQVLLGRYAGQEDFVVGSPFSGRSRAEFAPLVGYFVNPVALRANLAGDPTFRQLLRRVRQSVLEALEHQDYPFPVLIERLRPNRGADQSPLFNVMFVLEKPRRPEARGVAPLVFGTAGAPLRVGGLTLEPFAFRQRTALFDLMLTFVDDGGPLSASLRYDADLFEPDTVERLALNLQTLLGEVASTPEQRVGELRLLSEAERRRVLVEWNRTARPYEQGRCLHELFEAQAGATPESTAVVCGGEEVSYAELDARAERVAARLRALGAGPERLVGVCLERGVDLVAALLGVLKAGGAYVPLDPAYPRQRLEQMLDDAGASLVLAQEATLGSLPPKHAAAAVCLGRERDDFVSATTPPDTRGAAARPENAAYVIYTSGSTGGPKGVVIEHRSAAAFVAWAADAYGPEGLSAVLASTSVCFDLSVFELFAPLAVGGRVVVVRNALEAAEASASGVSLINTVPSAAAELVRLGALPPAVRTVNLAGEALPRPLVDALYAVEGVERVVNLYGPTEYTTYTTAEEVGRDDAERPAIGRPIANTQVYILDGRMEPAPVGVTGEVFIGGAGLARGYWNRPHMTAERFVPNPFAREPGARLYRTGDLARHLHDGRIDYLGRADHQVKVRGFRIELEEIAARLGQHPSVREAVVNVRDDGAAGKRLVAYVVAERGQSCAWRELRAYLKESFPEHMVPSACVVLDALPLTPNGKVDRKALPAPAAQPQAEDEGTYAAPSGAVEELLAGVWAEVLGVERVGARDNFFDIGGHSLLATRVVSRVRTLFDVELPLRSIFEAQTLAELAAVIEAARAGGRRVTLPPVAPVRRDGDLPLSFAQQRLWFFDRLEPGNPFYNVPVALRLSGRLDRRALAESLAEVVRRHEALRTTFPAAGGRPAQAVRPSLEVELPLVDLGGLPAEEREAEALRRAAEEARLPFDLARGPLLRAGLVRLSDEEHLLLLTMHHIVSDGWSMGVLVRETAALYEAFTGGAPSPLEEPAIQYADFAAWQREWLGGDALAEQLDYWKRQLAGAPPTLELPAKGARPPARSYEGATETLLLPKGLAERVNELSRREGVTPFMLLLGAFQALLCRYTGQTDVVVGTSIANRTRAEVEGLIGFFVNALVMRTDVSGDPTFRELLLRVREVALGAYAHQDLPFEMLVEELQPERDLNHTPLFQVMFVLQNAPRQTLELSDLRLCLQDTSSGTSKFDLTLFVQPSDDGLLASVEYSTDLFDARMMRRMLGHLRVLLEGVTANPDLRVAELPLLTEAERHELLHARNETAADYPEDACVHELFEGQVRLTPHETALTLGGESLTYAELNERADRVARLLRARGAGPETPVTLCVERSFEMVAGLLGVLKAGAAYVPIDPAYPAGRRRLILEEARSPLLLTQRKFADAFEGTKADVIALDATDLFDPAPDAPADAGAENPSPLARPENLAYVIYTSGSTGRPKGVMVTHRGVVNYLSWCRRAYRVAEGRGAPVHSSLGFDLTVTSLFAPLVSGRGVVLVPEGEGAESLRSVLDSGGGFSLIKITPAHLSLLAELVPPSEAARQTRALVIGGEALHGEALSFWREHAPGTRVVNEYGPTEAVVGCCVYEVPAGEAPSSGAVPIGRPIANTQLYLLDANLRPVPEGVWGEIHIGGAGLARGYTNQPALTAERFVPNPFGARPGGRLYRTGDVARYRPDGQIEFLGRRDDQVKLRGYRIELGEIEAALARHPAVGEAAVVLREDVPGDKRLVAYVVHESADESHAAESEAAELSAEQVAEWQDVFEQSHDDPRGALDPYFDITGWNSSYTGEPIPPEEMREWVDTTVERIRSLRPRRVLEIGCGTGLLLFRIAPGCERYTATDFSSAALSKIRGALDAHVPAVPSVSLLQRAAEDFEGIPEAAYDAVVVNSVAQYFPSGDYLLRVLKGAARRVAPGGFVFVGDVRCRRLLGEFYTSLELFQAAPATAAEELRQRVSARAEQEEELVLDPDFFRAVGRELEGVGPVEVLLKRGGAHNELTKFRYDVILHVGGGAHAAGPVPAHDWRRERLTLPALRALLESERPDALRVLRVPNARLGADVSAARLLSDESPPATAAALREALRARGADCEVDPEEFWKLETELPYTVELYWPAAEEPDCFDALLVRRDGEEAASRGRLAALAPGREGSPRQSWRAYCNDPLRRRSLRRLVPELRLFLRQTLPDYMLPSAFVSVSALPLTPHGKVDRRQLPAPGRQRNDPGGSYVAPRNAVEEVLADIWAQVLEAERVGAHDNFFDLGGHSLLGTQVTSRIFDAFSVELPLRRLFEAPTPAGLAEALLEASPDRLRTERKAELLSRLSRLSDEQVQAMLAARAAAPLDAQDND